jgi:uncharacterized membrane protein
MSQCDHTTGGDKRRVCDSKECAGRWEEVTRQTSVRWSIRSMRHEDIAKCLEIWLLVELTEAHVTVANVLTIDPAGFYVAVLESSGKICSVVCVCVRVWLANELFNSDHKRAKHNQIQNKHLNH